MSAWKVQTNNFGLKFRLVYLAIGILAFVLAYYVGAIGIPLSDEDANQIVQDFTTRAQGIQEDGIFSNNVLIGLGMFIPGAGAGMGVYAGASTGIVYNAFAHMNPEIAEISPLSLLVTPFGILEMFAYGLAMSRSAMLAFYIAKKKPWKEYLLMTGIEVAIVVLALVVGAVIEAEALRQMSEGI